MFVARPVQERHPSRRDGMLNPCGEPGVQPGPFQHSELTWHPYGARVPPNGVATNLRSLRDHPSNRKEPNPTHVNPFTHPLIHSFTHSSLQPFNPSILQPSPVGSRQRAVGNQTFTPTRRPIHSFLSSTLQSFNSSTFPSRQ